MGTFPKIEPHCNPSTNLNPDQQIIYFLPSQMLILNLTTKAHISANREILMQTKLLKENYIKTKFVNDNNKKIGTSGWH